jgi:antitoxin component YwqK of YwqJK toxin-antitoxin module
MKKGLLLFAVLAAAQTVAQAQAFEKSVFEGKSVYVFPYRLEGNWKNNTAEYSILPRYDELRHIPFCPVPLPDGDFLAYYPLPETSKRPTQRDSTHIAVSFSIKNGKKNGLARFFTGKTYQNGVAPVYWEGQYVEDKKEGVWTHRSYNYNGIPTRTTKITFHQDVPDGPVMIYDHRMRLTETSTYRQGLKTGEQQRFDAQGRPTEVIPYVHGKRHGWSWDTIFPSKGMEAAPYSSYRRYYEDDKPTPELVETSANKVLEVRFLDSVDASTYQDSGFWYTKPQSWEQINGWLHGDELNTYLDYSAASFVRNRYEVEQRNSSNETHSAIFLGEHRRVFPSLRELPSAIIHGETYTNLRIENRHIRLDTTYGNLFHLRVTAEGKKVYEAFYLLKDFKLRRIYNMSQEKFLGKKGFLETRKERAPEYFTLVLQEEVPLYFTASESHIYDSRGRLYYGEVKQKIYTRDTVYTLFSFKSFDSRMNRIRPSLTWEIVRLPNGNLNILQWSQLPQMPLRFQVMVHISADVLSARRFNDLPEFDLSDQFIYKHLSNGFPDQVSSSLWLQDRPFTGTWIIKLPKTRQPNGKIMELGSYHGFRLERRKRPYGGGYNLFMHVKAQGSIDLLSRFSLIGETYRWNYTGKTVPDRAIISTFWTKGVISGAEMELQRLQRSIITEYVEGFKHGSERIQWQYGKDAAVEQFTNNYERGLRSGFFRGTYQLPQDIRPYVAGKPEGLHVISINRDGAKLAFNMKANQLQDALVFTQFNAQVQDSLPLEQGRPHGIYRAYRTDMVQDITESGPFAMMSRTTRSLSSEIPFTQGYANGTARFWFENGGLKAEVKFRPDDSVKLLLLSYEQNGSFFLDVLGKNGPILPVRDYYAETERLQKTGIQEQYRLVLSYQAERGSATITGNYEQGFVGLSPNWTADYTYYFLNGQPSQHGRVAQERRTGWWSFWNEEGKKMKEVDYTAGVTEHPLRPGDSIRYKGKIKGYRPDNGQLMYEGYVLDESFDYSCATQTDLTFEDILYTAFFDSAGNQTLQHYSGPVYDFHINRVKRFEGFVKDGVRDSVWYFYTNGATLEEAGKYRQGKKHGRWLNGDLEGINFLDHQCFDPSESYKMTRLNNELDFTEEVYDSGKLLRSDRHFVRLDGYAENFQSFATYKGSGNGIPSEKELRKLDRDQPTRKYWNRNQSRRNKYRHEFGDF